MLRDIVSPDSPMIHANRADTHQQWLLQEVILERSERVTYLVFAGLYFQSAIVQAETDLGSMEAVKELRRHQWFLLVSNKKVYMCVPYQTEKVVKVD